MCTLDFIDFITQSGSHVVIDAESRHWVMLRESLKIYVRTKMLRLACASAISKFVRLINDIYNY